LRQFGKREGSHCLQIMTADGPELVLVTQILSAGDRQDLSRPETGPRGDGVDLGSLYLCLPGKRNVRLLPTPLPIL
jgi:hypothetical protein